MIENSTESHSVFTLEEYLQSKYPRTKAEAVLKHQTNNYEWLMKKKVGKGADEKSYKNKLVIIFL
jgi:hypothetical protein